MLVSASYWGSQKSRRTLDFGMMWDKCCSGQSDCGCYDRASWTLIFLSIHFLPTVLRMLRYFPCSTLRWFSLVLFSHFYPCTILRSPGMTLGISCDPKGVSWPIGLVHLLDQDLQYGTLHLMRMAQPLVGLYCLLATSMSFSSVYSSLLFYSILFPSLLVTASYLFYLLHFCSIRFSSLLCSLVTLWTVCYINCCMSSWEP